MLTITTTPEQDAALAARLKKQNVFQQEQGQKEFKDVDEFATFLFQTELNSQVAQEQADEKIIVTDALAKATPEEIDQVKAILKIPTDKI